MAVFGGAHDQATYRQVAELHAANIDQGFLSSLGVTFLALLYEAIDACDSSVLFVAKSEQSVVGFVVGAESMGPIYRQLFRFLPRLVWALLPALLSPRKLWKITELLFLGHKVEPFEGLADAELLSIVVNPAHRGQGHAESLYLKLMQHFRQRGISAFRIVVGTSLTSAHHFYLKMGARPVGHLQVHQGQQSVIYQQESAPCSYVAHRP